MSLTHEERLALALQFNSRLAAVKQAGLIATRDLIRTDVLSVEETASLVDLYPAWEPNIKYKAGDLFAYKGTLYEVREGQDHTSQADWLPDGLPALYKSKAPAGTIPAYDPDRNLAVNPFQPGEKMIWTDGLIYESIHPSPHGWTPADYPAAWKLVV